MAAVDTTSQPFFLRAASPFDKLRMSEMRYATESRLAIGGLILDPPDLSEGIGLASPCPSLLRHLQRRSPHGGQAGVTREPRSPEPTNQNQLL